MKEGNGVGRFKTCMLVSQFVVRLDDDERCNGSRNVPRKCGIQVIVCANKYTRIRGEIGT